MKKYLVLFAIAFSAVGLSSFVLNNRISVDKNSDSDRTFYTKVTAYYEDSDSQVRTQTLYIFYDKEDDGSRTYLANYTDNEYAPMYTVKTNPLYKSFSCTDFRKNYKFVFRDHIYFNCNLPYRSKYNQ